MASDSDEIGTNKIRRRTKSVTYAEEITTKNQKQRRSQPDKPCHRPCDSLFSRSGFHNFTGLVNWGFLLLTMSGFRLLLENLIKYGIRVDPIQWFIVLTGRDEGADFYSLGLMLYSMVPICICLLIEIGLSLGIFRESPGVFAHIVNIIVLVLIPMVIIHVNGNAFGLIGAMSVCFHYSILFLKLWSYVQVNMWCRETLKMVQTPSSRKRSKSISVATYQNVVDGDVAQLVEYPANLTFSDLMYFLCTPTLCYELNFPQTSRIRKRFLLKRILEVVIGINVILGLFQQWMIPAVRNSLIPFSNMDVAKATERLLKLAIPNHFFWLCFFYIAFHSFLNLVGELLHFADRTFYCDWWNASNIDTFWRAWNMPVHRWCVRHVYIPIVDLGYSRMTASLAVFFISAFFHEYLVSVPLKTFKIWAFMGMMGQIPLSYVSRYIEKNYGPRWGNTMVWASLILGQPLCIMMYYHDYVVEHFNEAIQNSEI